MPLSGLKGHSISLEFAAFYNSSATEVKAYLALHWAQAASERRASRKVNDVKGGTLLNNVVDYLSRPLGSRDTVLLFGAVQ